MASVEAWLNRRWVWVMAVLLLASAGVRIGYFSQLNGDPAIELHRFLQSDMNYFDAWGRTIAHGDWLSESVTVPMHGWQRSVADQYLTNHPETRTTLQHTGQSAGADAGLLLWSRWMGGHQFYQDPLYPYLLGLTYHLFGEDVRVIFAWQMALGVVSTLLIWLIAWRFFGPVVGVCAGALAVLCGPLIYYDLVLLRETTIVFAGLALVWLTDVALARRRWVWFGLLGISIGLACLLKSSFVLLGASLMAGIVAWFHFRWRELRVPVAALVAGLVLAVVPLAARNIALGVPPLALARLGGVTFMMSNDINYDPARGWDPDPRRLGQLMDESVGGLLPAVVATLRPHTPASYLKLLWRKWDRAWQWVELPNNDNFYYVRLRAPILAWLPVTFWLCSPLALAGLVLGMRRLSRAWPLYLLVAGSLIPLLMFYVLGRFRIPLTAALLPFVALAFVEALRWTGEGRYGRVIALAASVCVLSVWTGRPARTPLVRAADWLVPFVVRYQPQYDAAVAAHNPAAAATAYLAFFQEEPGQAQLLSPPDVETLLMLGTMHTECASLLREAGRMVEANQQVGQAGAFLRPVLTLDPSRIEANLVLGDALFAGKSYADAAAYYDRYLRHQPNNVGVVQKLGIALVNAGNADGALAVFRRAAQIDPTNSRSQRDLAYVLYDRGRLDEAADHASRAVTLTPDVAAAHDIFGRILAMQGKIGAARAEFEASLRLDPSDADARENLRLMSR
ncbi:MAG TPA: tetratricopeptide repeat protein [Vicinamibacterales bacterium]|nr:tetratricopeptide repeat protein [Vicinamibacterales bacterium]